MTLRQAHATTPPDTPGAVTHMHVEFEMQADGSWVAREHFIECKDRIRADDDHPEAVGRGRTVEVALRDLLRQLNDMDLVVRLRPL